MEAQTAAQGRSLQRETALKDLVSLRALERGVVTKVETQVWIETAGILVATVQTTPVSVLFLLIPGGASESISILFSHTCFIEG